MTPNTPHFIATFWTHCYISSTILPVPVGTAPPNSPPAGVPSHSSGTWTLQPLALLTHRTIRGSGLSGSGASGSPGVVSVPSAAAARPRRLGACFRSSRLIVSICKSQSSCSLQLISTTHIAHPSGYFLILPFLPHCASRSGSSVVEPSQLAAWRVLQPSNASSLGVLLTHELVF